MTREQLLVIHEIAIEFYDNYEEGVTEEQIGVKHPDLLLSALGEIRQTFDEQELYPTIYLKAGCLVRCLIKNHTFHNANKRTAILSLIVFLAINGYELTAKRNQLIHFSRGIAISQRSVESIARDIKRWCVPVGKLKDAPAMPGRKRYILDFWDRLVSLGAKRRAGK